MFEIPKELLFLEYRSSDSDSWLQLDTLESFEVRMKPLKVYFCMYQSQVTQVDVTFVDLETASFFSLRVRILCGMR